jgi:hypothetical protein
MIGNPGAFQPGVCEIAHLCGDRQRNFLSIRRDNSDGYCNKNRNLCYGADRFGITRIPITTCGGAVRGPAEKYEVQPVNFSFGRDNLPSSGNNWT